MAPLSHIYTLHAIGSQDGIDFLVMEYLKGETLAQRVIKGALPLDQVLKYAIEIVDALDKAHRKGIVHLDLKPGNIMLTKAGGGEAPGLLTGEATGAERDGWKSMYGNGPARGPSPAPALFPFACPSVRGVGFAPIRSLVDCALAELP